MATTIYYVMINARVFTNQKVIDDCKVRACNVTLRMSAYE